MNSFYKLTLLSVFIVLLSLRFFAISASAENLCRYAVLYGSSGYINQEERDIFAFDGNYDTKWCATYDNIIMSKETREVFELGYMHWLAVDLGDPRYFDSYKLIHASKGLRDFGIYDYNAVAWAVQISDDGKNWTTVSEFYDNYEETTEVFIGIRLARYIRLMISQPEASGGSTVRLPEFELYECAEGKPAEGMISELLTETEPPAETAREPETTGSPESQIPENTDKPAENEAGTKITGAHIAGIVITAIAALGTGFTAYHREFWTGKN